MVFLVTYCKFLPDFLSNRKQKVVLNGQNSSWTNVYAGVPLGSILGPLLFLIQINELADDLSSNVKLFADDTLLNDDLKKINKWAFQCKISFNPDSSKQAQEIILVVK